MYAFIGRWKLLKDEISIFWACLCNICMFQYLVYKLIIYTTTFTTTTITKILLGSEKFSFIILCMCACIWIYTLDL